MRSSSSRTATCRWTTRGSGSPHPEKRRAPSGGPVTDFPSLDREHAALLACALAPRRVDLSPLVRKLVAEGFDWPRLAHAAAWHHLRPQLVARLAGAGFDSPPH